MQLLKYRIFNKYRVTVLVATLFGLFLYWYISQIYSYTLGFNLNAEDIAGHAREVQKQLIEQRLYMDKYMDIVSFSTNLLPVFILFLTILFYNEKKGLFAYRYIRGENQKKVVLGSIIQYALINAITLYFIYIIYMTVGYLFIGNRMNLPRNTFDGIFGEGFSNHVYLYYLCEGFISYFIGTFVLTFFSCCVALHSKKKYQSVVIPLGYYWGMTIFISFIGQIALEAKLPNLVRFQPAYIYGFQSYMHDSPGVDTIFKIMTPLLIPVIISIILLIIEFYQKEKIHD